MKKMIRKKNESILETDVVLIYIDNNPSFFARIEDITADAKKGWWRVRLLILQIPLMVTTWILDNEQMSPPCAARITFSLTAIPYRSETGELVTLTGFTPIAIVGVSDDGLVSMFSMHQPPSSMNELIEMGKDLTRTTRVAE